jgi:hypothetical protein
MNPFDRYIHNVDPIFNHHDNLQIKKELEAKPRAQYVV